MLFVLAQICGVIVLILTVISVQFKTKEKNCDVFCICKPCNGNTILFTQCYDRSDYINY